MQVALKNSSLRPFEDMDAMPMVVAMNTDTIARDTTIPLPFKLDDAKWWIGYIRDAAEQSPPKEKHFVLEIGGNFAGSVGLINIEGHKAELGYWLVDEYAGKGVMSEAVALMVEHGFEKMGLTRIFAPVLTHNKASARVLEKNGFTLEGILRNYFMKNNTYKDAWCYAKVK